MVQREELSEGSPPPEAATPAPQRHRARSIVAAVLGVLTVLVLTITLVSVWAKATVLQPEPVARIVSDALADPQVQTALADRITTEVVSAVDLDAELAKILPAPLTRFAPSIAAGAQTAIERALTKALETPEVQNAIVELVERAHAIAMRLLDGGGLSHGVSVDDGTVTLNLVPLINRGLETVQKIGVLSNVTLPQMTADGDPQQQIQQLSQALGRPLPETFGQLEVYHSEKLANAQANLEAAQDLLVAAKRAVWLMVVLFVALAAATIIVAPRRWRAAMVLGVGVAGAMAVLRTTVREVVAQAPELTEKPGGKQAIRIMLGSATSSLMKLAALVLILGLVLAAVAIVRRRRWRADLVIVVAVAIGVSVPAIAGLRIWSALLGLALGVAVPFVARWLLSPRSGDVDDPPAGPVTPIDAAAVTA